MRDYTSYYTYQKCLQIGIFVEAQTEVSKELYGVPPVETFHVVKNKRIQISEYTMEFISILNEIFIDE